MRPRLALVFRLVLIGAVAVGLWFFTRSIQWHKLGEAFRHARWWPLGIAAALGFACLWGKALGWHIILAPRYRVPILPLFRYTISAFAASVIAPARAGEVVRVWELKRNHGVPISEGAAVAVAEKLLDGLSMLLLVAPLPWLLPGLPSWVEHAMMICAGIAISVFVVLFVAVGRIEVNEGSSWLARFIGGMHVVRNPRRLLLASLSLMGVWAADLCMVYLVMYAVGIQVPILAGLLVLFTLNLSIAVPSTPAQLGALEIGVLAATRLLGVPDEPALAFALLYHAVQILPLLVAGLALGLGRRREPLSRPQPEEVHA